MTAPVLVPWRRGWPLVVAVAVAQTAVLASWRTWVGSWPQTAAALGQVLLITGPVAAGMSAWVVRGEHREGIRWLWKASSRPRSLPAFRLGAECSLWAMAGLVLGSLIPVVWTAREAAFGRPGLWVWLPMAAGVFGVCLLGVVAGLRLRSIFAAVAAAVGIYGVTVAALFIGDDILAALSPYDGRTTFFYQIPAWIHALQGIWFALAATAVLVRFEGLRRASGFLAIAAGLAASPLLLVGWDDRRPDPEAMRFVCETGPRVEVCLPQAKVHMLAEVVAAADEFWTVADGLVEQGIRLVDDEAAGIAGFDEALGSLPEAPGNQVMLSAFTDISAVSRLDRPQFLGDLVRWTVGPQRLDPADAQPSRLPAPATPADVLTRWLYEQLDLPLDGSGWPGAPILDERAVDYTGARDRLQWLTARSPEDRREWFVEHRSQIMSGTLTFDAFD